ncbi:MAG: flagellar biosynthetic protein FliR [Desulfobacterales bacterium]
MTTLTISLEQLQLFLIVFTRVAAIIASIPVLGGRNIPVLLKVGLILAISVLVFPQVSIAQNPFLKDGIFFAVGLAGEVMLGVAIGLMAQMIFAGVQLAGELAGYQMGLAIANVIDPDSNDQIPLISQFYQVYAMLIFVTVNAHYWCLGAMLESFRLIPPFGFHLDSSLTEQLVRLGGDVFTIGVKVGAPVIVVLLLTSVSFGLIARTVPQMNVFVVAMPLKIAVGLLFVFFSLPYFSAYLQQLFLGLGENIMQLLSIVHP